MACDRGNDKGVMTTPMANDGTHLELSGDRLERLISASCSRPESLQFHRRNEQLRRNAIAKPLDVIVGRLQIRKIKYAITSQPHMCQFVRERKHLRRFKVSSVDENQRSERITENKSAKLIRVEFSLVAVPNNAVDDNNDSDRFRGATQGEQRRRPCCMFARPAVGHSDRFSNASRRISLA